MDSQTLIIILTFVVLTAFGFGILIFIINRKFAGQKPNDIESQKLMLEVIENLRRDIQDGHLKNRREIEGRLDRINDQLNRGLSDSSKTLQRQFAQSAQIIQDVTSRLTQLDQTNKQVLDFSKQLQSLENILKNPKQRGILGEYYLETVLKNVLPPKSYQMQYKFKDGSIVDAVIFFNNLIIPIDSKFSLENYNKIVSEKDHNQRLQLEKIFKQDLKNRIDETAKYIRLDEHTTDYAFMFIPAEAIYYDLLVNQVGTIKINTRDLIEYANREKHVIIVSPTTFHVYLQLFAEGLRRWQIGESVKEIIKKVNGLGKHLNSYEIYMQKLGGNLGTTVNMYNQAYREFGKIDKDVYKITDGQAGGKADVEKLNKPETSEEI